MRPVTFPVHASLTSSTKWRQCLLCYDQCKRSWCTLGTSVRSERAPGLSDRILIGTGEVLNLGDSWDSCHLARESAISSGWPVSAPQILFLVSAHFCFLCHSPGTEAYHECLDHYGGPLSGLFDSRLCCLHYCSHPFLATPVYSRIFPRTTFWASPHCDTPSGFSGPTGQHLNRPPGKSSFSVLILFIHGFPHSTNIC